MAVDKVTLKEEEIVGSEVVLTDINPVTNTRSVQDTSTGESMEETLERVWNAINNKLSRIVNSVNGRTGVVVLDSNDVGLGNVDNVSFSDIKDWVLDQLSIWFANKRIRLYANILEAVNDYDHNDELLKNTPFYCEKFSDTECRACIGYFYPNEEEPEKPYKIRFINTVGYTDHSIIYNENLGENKNLTGGGIGVNIWEYEDALQLYSTYANNPSLTKANDGLMIDKNKLAGRIYYVHGLYGFANGAFYGKNGSYPCASNCFFYPTLEEMGTLSETTKKIIYGENYASWSYPSETLDTNDQPVSNVVLLIHSFENPNGACDEIMGVLNPYFCGYKKNEIGNDTSEFNYLKQGDIIYFQFIDYRDFLTDSEASFNDPFARKIPGTEMLTNGMNRKGIFNGHAIGYVSGAYRRDAKTHYTIDVYQIQQPAGWGLTYQDYSDYNTTSSVSSHHTSALSIKPVSGSFVYRKDGDVENTVISDENISGLNVYGSIHRPSINDVVASQQSETGFSDHSFVSPSGPLENVIKPHDHGIGITTDASLCIMPWKTFGYAKEPRRQNESKYDQYDKKYDHSALISNWCTYGSSKYMPYVKEEDNNGKVRGILSNPSLLGINLNKVVVQDTVNDQPFQYGNVSGLRIVSPIFDPITNDTSYYENVKYLNFSNTYGMNYKDYYFGLETLDFEIEGHPLTSHGIIQETEEYIHSKDLNIAFMMITNEFASIHNMQENTSTSTLEEDIVALQDILHLNMDAIGAKIVAKLNDTIGVNIDPEYTEYIFPSYMIEVFYPIPMNRYRDTTHIFDYLREYYYKTLIIGFALLVKKGYLIHDNVTKDAIASHEIENNETISVAFISYLVDLAQILIASYNTNDALTDNQKRGSSAFTLVNSYCFVDDVSILDELRQNTELSSEEKYDEAWLIYNNAFYEEKIQPIIEEHPEYLSNPEDYIRTFLSSYDLTRKVSSGLMINVGDFLEIDPGLLQPNMRKYYNSGKLNVRIGKGLIGEKTITKNIDDHSYHVAGNRISVNVGPGLTINNYNGSVTVNPGEGLSIKNDKLRVQLGQQDKYLSSDNPQKFTTGLKIVEGGNVSVAVTNGLQIIKPTIEQQTNEETGDKEFVLTKGSPQGDIGLKNQTLLKDISIQEIHGDVYLNNKATEPIYTKLLIKDQNNRQILYDALVGDTSSLVTTIELGPGLIIVPDDYMKNLESIRGLTTLITELTLPQLEIYTKILYYFNNTLYRHFYEDDILHYSGTSFTALDLDKITLQQYRDGLYRIYADLLKPRRVDELETTDTSYTLPSISPKKIGEMVNTDFNNLVETTEIRYPRRHAKTGDYQPSAETISNVNYDELEEVTTSVIIDDNTVYTLYDSPFSDRGFWRMLYGNQSMVSTHKCNLCCWDIFEKAKTDKKTASDLLALMKECISRERLSNMSIMELSSLILNDNKPGFVNEAWKFFMRQIKEDYVKLIPRLWKYMRYNGFRYSDYPVTQEGYDPENSTDIVFPFDATTDPIDDSINNPNRTPIYASDEDINDDNCCDCNCEEMHQELTSEIDQLRATIEALQQQLQNYIDTHPDTPITPTPEPDNPSIDPNLSEYTKINVSSLSANQRCIYEGIVEFLSRLIDETTPAISVNESGIIIGNDLQYKPSATYYSSTKDGLRLLYGNHSSFVDSVLRVLPTLGEYFYTGQDEQPRSDFYYTGFNSTAETPSYTAIAYNTTQYLSYPIGCVNDVSSEDPYEELFCGSSGPTYTVESEGTTHNYHYIQCREFHYFIHESILLSYLKDPDHMHDYEMQNATELRNSDIVNFNPGLFYVGDIFVFENTMMIAHSYTYDDINGYKIYGWGHGTDRAMQTSCQEIYNNTHLSDGQVAQIPLVDTEKGISGYMSESVSKLKLVIRYMHNRVQDNSETVVKLIHQPVQTYKYSDTTENTYPDTKNENGVLQCDIEHQLNDSQKRLFYALHKYIDTIDKNVNDSIKYKYYGNSSKRLEFVDGESGWLYGNQAVAFCAMWRLIPYLYGESVRYTARNNNELAISCRDFIDGYKICEYGSGTTASDDFTYIEKESYDVDDFRIGDIVAFQSAIQSIMFVHSYCTRSNPAKIFLLGYGLESEVANRAEYPDILQSKTNGKIPNSLPQLDEVTRTSPDDFEGSWCRIDQVKLIIRYKGVENGKKLLLQDK